MSREDARRRPALSPRLRSLAFALAFAGLSAASARAEAPELPAPTLPTPYTAEQIRDAWRLGFSVVVRTRDAEGERVVRRSVVAWSAEGVTLRVQGLDASGQPTGEPRDVSATWEELRRHALFPEASATRERAHRETAIGPLDGWLYRVKTEDGTTTEFFFGDATPGMPVQFGERRGESWISQSEQVSRTPAP